MRRSLICFIALLAALLFSGCAALQEMVRKPTVKFEGLTLTDMTLFAARPVFRLRVSNPNPLGLKINSVAYDLKINGRPFLKDVMEKGIALPAKGAAVVDIPVTLNYLNLYESVMEFIRSDRIAYDFSGTVGLGMFEVPYSAAGDVDLPKMPDVALKRLRVERLSFTGASLEMTLEVGNRNPFPVDLSGLNYGLKLGGREIASGRAGRVSAIDENGAVTVRIPLDVSFLELGKTVFSLLSGSSAQYELFGDMQVGGKEIPFQKAGKIPLKR